MGGFLLVPFSLFVSLNFCLFGGSPNEWIDIFWDTCPTESFGIKTTPRIPALQRFFSRGFKAISSLPQTCGLACLPSGSAKKSRLSRFHREPPHAFPVRTFKLRPAPFWMLPMLFAAFGIGRRKKKGPNLDNLACDNVPCLPFCFAGSSKASLTRRKEYVLQVKLPGTGTPKCTNLSMVSTVYPFVRLVGRFACLVHATPAYWISRWTALLLQLCCFMTLWPGLVGNQWEEQTATDPGMSPLQSHVNWLCE